MAIVDKCIHFVIVFFYPGIDLHLIRVLIYIYKMEDLRTVSIGFFRFLRSGFRRFRFLRGFAGTGSQCDCPCGQAEDYKKERQDFVGKSLLLHVFNLISAISILMLL